MSTIRVDNISTTDDQFSASVEDIVKTTGIKQEIASPSGAAMVGWERQLMLGAASTVGYMLSASARSVWEFADLVLDKPDPNSPDTWDWTPALQAALDALSNGESLSFAGGRTYRTSAPLVMPPNLVGCVFYGCGATIKADHSGDGLVIIATNENYSRHTFYDLNILGPNVSYPNNPAELEGVSTGAALKMGRDSTTIEVAGYLVSFYNCRFTNFHKGIYLQGALLCNFYGGYVAFNQYGIYFDSGNTNANRFFGVSVRENRRVGIYSSGRTGGSLTKASANMFFGCEIETNIPYDASNGGYPSTFNDTGVGVGILLRDSYSFVFDGCYSENHNYGVWLEASSDDNKFLNCRFAQGGAGGIRFDGVKISDLGSNNNIFNDCEISNPGRTEGNVIIDNSSAILNKFINCTGFIFERSKIQPWQSTYIQNSYRSQGTGSGTVYGALTATPEGIVRNPDEGEAPGRISGIGTDAATINALGIAEMELGSLITGDTTITEIQNMKPGQIFVLSNYQIANKVTVKSSTSGTSGIVLKNRQDVVLEKYGDSITFYCMGVGRVVEVGRSIEGLGGGFFTTAQRNAMTGVPRGTQIFDTNLNKPIWRNSAGTGWVDANGTAV